MNRKGLVVVFVLLAVGTGIIPSMAQNIEKPLPTLRDNWLYVGGNGPGNYSTIKDAVKNASAGDTIFVYHGIYREAAIQISNLNLLGEDRNTTIINGSEIFPECLHVEGETTIHGFTIINSNGGVGIFTGGAEHIKISDNIITKCAQGIYLMGLHQIEIYHNSFSYNTDAAIILMFGLFNQYSIHDNYFFSNHIGIQAQGGAFVSIVQNHFEKNEIGVTTSGCHAKINQNNFINNTQQAYFETAWYIPFMLIYPTYYKPSFFNNYWNDWEKTTPRPIQGTFWFCKVRWLVILGILPGNFIWAFSFPILRKFDWHPAQEPYDIEVYQ